MTTIGLVILVAVALGFDFTNGFHDAANAVATAISTRALQPLPALMMVWSWSSRRWWARSPGT
jgi:PiT family inorganic phosphate transporter